MQGQLPQFLAESRATGTVKRYTAAFRRWKDFANLHKLQLWPTKPSDFCLYILHIAKTARGISALDATYYGVKWVHDCVDLKSPTDFSSVKNAFESAKRKLSRARKPVDPVPVEVLNKVGAEYCNSDDLAVIRSVSMAILAFAGFFRADEVRKIKAGDILMHDGFMTVVLRQSKTDQFRQGDHVDIVKTDSVSCPMFWLSKYLRKAGIDLSNESQSDMYIFRQISASKSGKKLVSTNRPLSDSAVRESVLPLIRRHMQAKARIGLHSFRSGGASAAAKAGAESRLLQRLGRWKVQASKDRYIQESLEHRLQVSSLLGL